jgi:hypothetical protein
MREKSIRVYLHTFFAAFIAFGIGFFAYFISMQMLRRLNCYSVASS